MCKKVLQRLLLIIITSGFYSFVFAQIRLPKLISDGMILQRDAKVKVWGRAAAGEKVTLDFQQQQYNAIADNAGKWMILLPAQKAGGPYEMTFSGSNTITIKNILFGDVWLCSGQSNMELTMDRLVDKYPEVISTSENHNIRQFLIPDVYDFEKPHDDVSGGAWIAASPKNVLQFSAAAYFFADDLYKKYGVPIGLINSALGGSPAEAWISEDALKKYPAYYNEVQKFKDKNLIASIEADDNKNSREWYNQLYNTDEGIKNNWKSEALDDKDWQKMNIPGYWVNGPLGKMNGSVWFRKEINVPASMTGKPAKLLMGRIVDADSVFINGKFVGTTSYQYPPRRYILEPDVLKAGKNEIVVRVISNSGDGGFVLDKPYMLVAGNDTINIAGIWKYKAGAKMYAMPSQTFIRWKPAGLYNAMIAPLTNYAIKGVIWYQGEANTGKPAEYTGLMRTLIENWRMEWQQGNFPFIYVQLPNFMEARNEPSESNWAALRQAQLKLLPTPITAMVIAIDLGEWNDIHPLNKQDIGKRLALQAEKIAYGEKNIIASGPLYQSAKLKRNKVTLSFTNTGSGIVSTGNEQLKYFAIAGADKKFVWANAEIKNNKVIVWSDAVPKPVFVRYAWADNPGAVNFYNKEGLPASPFEAEVSKN